MVKKFTFITANWIINFIYGLFCFFFAPVAFLVSGFYMSFFIITTISLFMYILIPQEFIYAYIIFGLFSSFWGVGILSEKVRLQRKLTASEELNIGFQSISEGTIYILFSLLVSCYFYAIMSLLDIGSDMFKNIVFVIIYLFVHLYTIAKSFSISYDLDNTSIN